MPDYISGDKLMPADRTEVLAAYVYRMTVENAEKRPDIAAYMRRHGYKLPLISDAQWLAETYFAVRKDGRLDRRVRYCSGYPR